MRLTVPTLAPALRLVDTDGKFISVYNGRPVLLTFFRDAACPFCNMRIVWLTRHYQQLSSLGLDVVAVFASTPEEIRRFVLRVPRPFPVAAEPELTAYDCYGVETSFWGKVRAIVTRVPTLVRGLHIVGIAGLNTNNVLPADFLVNGNRTILHAYYGKDAGDHMPLEDIKLFMAKYGRVHVGRPSGLVKPILH